MSINKFGRSKNLFASILSLSELGFRQKKIYSVDNHEKYDNKMHFQGLAYLLEALL